MNTMKPVSVVAILFGVGLLACANTAPPASAEPSRTEQRAEPASAAPAEDAKPQPPAPIPSPTPHDDTGATPAENPPAAKTASAEGTPATDGGPVPLPPDFDPPPADATKTASGLAFKVLQAGQGTEHPSPTDLVTVHYTGWLVDGIKFLLK